MKTHRPKVLFLNRSYWPDAEATGQLLTELCEDISSDFDVTVIAGQPNQNPQDVSFRRHGIQQHRHVQIHRVWNSRFHKSSFAGRAINLVTYLVTAAIAAFTVRRPDIVVVETDPPLLCLIGSLVRFWRRCHLVVYLQDIYPDLAVALGKLPDGKLTRLLRWFMFQTYRNADLVVVLSADMRKIVIAAGVRPDRVRCIPNWVDTRKVYPQKLENAFRQRLKLNGHFTVMYSGNMGLCQRLDDAVLAASRLCDRNDILFLFVGDGANRRRLEELAHEHGATNIRFLPYQPKGELAASLSAADLHLVPVDPRVIQYLMPSKLYGALASGTPVMAVAPESCELTNVVRDHQVGIVVPPGSPDKLAEMIAWGADNRDKFAKMGIRARELAVERYDRHHCTATFGSMLKELTAINSSAVVVAPIS